MTTMSTYDASHPAEGDSKITTTVKQMLTNTITELLKKNGFKVWIREEIPLYSIDEHKMYHGDLGVLCRNRQTDTYSFYIVEIDWEGHDTYRTERRDSVKDYEFHKRGIPVHRVKLRFVHGLEALSQEDIEEMLWSFFVKPQIPSIAAKNQELAIKLKENALAKCRNKKCQHPAQQHGLHGCNWQFPNKASMYCHCDEPHFISDT